MKVHTNMKPSPRIYSNALQARRIIGKPSVDSIKQAVSRGIRRGGAGYIRAIIALSPAELSDRDIFALGYISTFRDCLPEGAIGDIDVYCRVMRVANHYCMYAMKHGIVPF